MIRTTLVAGFIGLGVITAAPAMAAPDSTVSCSPPAVCANQVVTAPVPGLITTWQNGIVTAANTLATGPATAAGVWATGPQTVIQVWHDALVGPTPTS
jgi:hypothetical protein